MRPAVATYLYCIVQSAGPPSAAEAAPPGLPETADPRLVPLGDGLWLVVGDAPLPVFSGEEIERRLTDLAWVSACAVAHERVVAHFAALAPVIPMKLFTLFADDERAVAALSEERERLTAVLAKVAGHEEWGVRIHFDGGRAKRLTASPPTPGDPADAPVSGRSFLLRKKEAQEAARHLASRAGAAVDEAFDELSRHAAAAQRREPLAATAAEPGPRLLLDAAFLVSAGAAGFEQAVQAESERLAAYACEVTLTGPWPPYNFIAEVG